MPLLLLFGTRAHLLSPEEGSCYILSTRNNFCESLASYGVIFQSDLQPALIHANSTSLHLICLNSMLFLRKNYFYPLVVPGYGLLAEIQTFSFVSLQQLRLGWSYYVNISPRPSNYVTDHFLINIQSYPLNKFPGRVLCSRC